MTAIHLREVTVRLEGTRVLDGITLTLDHRRIAVIGANGSGKSTFARLLGGLVPAESGAVSVLGLDPARHAAQLRRRVSFIFSNPDAQIIMPTVAEDAALSLRSERLPKAESAARVAAALKEFGLADLADHPAHDLSGGQKQMLALCAALIRRPDLVIADEPTAYLDARNSRAIANRLLIGAHHRLVLVTHDLALAARCDAAVLFDAGRIVEAGETGDVIRRYEELIRC
jgi:biotin transport system ATP-binding protein